ncbi:MAG: dTDP-4-dehydrorhamnose 3,5-epimerase [Granulosicoccus sp.]
MCEASVRVIDTELTDVKILEPRVFGDERGFFLESWNSRVFEQCGLDTEFVQDNHSRSAQGVLRGLHYQLVNPQGKLVRVTQGEVYDVAVDMRRSSRQFGRWTAVTLSESNKRQLWVPPGFAHGFFVVSSSADFQYKCTDYYNPEHERTLLWNDPVLDIPWPLHNGQEPKLAEKDQSGQLLSDCDCFK